MALVYLTILLFSGFAAIAFILEEPKNTAPQIEA